MREGPLGPHFARYDSVTMSKPRPGYAVKALLLPYKGAKVGLK